VRAKFYVAGPSCDVQRFRKVADVMAGLGMELTYDWAAPIEANGLISPNSTVEQRRSTALSDAAAVRDAAVLIVLSPLPGQMAIGTWVEFGIAIGMRAARGARRPMIVLSSPHAAGKRQSTLFEELADIVTKGDIEAVHAAQRLAFSMELDDQGSNFMPIDLSDLVSPDE